jgi:protein-tyrosine phosphatase
MKAFREVELPPGVTGQLWLHSMPGRYEPLDEAWTEAQRLGVFSIICLAPLDEIREKSPDYARAIDEERLPCPVRRFPICDYQGPDDDEAFRRLAADIADVLRSDRRVLVHCGAGIGRTGMFAIAILITLGLSATEANRRVRAAHAGPERPAQEQALHRFLRQRANH